MTGDLSKLSLADLVVLLNETLERLRTAPEPKILENSRFVAAIVVELRRRGYKLAIAREDDHG